MSDNVTKAQRSRIMAAVKSTDTAPELVVRKLAHALGGRYRLHVRSLPGQPDLVFPLRRKVIFVHGCFWHMHTCGRCRIPHTRRTYWIAKLEGNRTRDKRHRRALRTAGWHVLTVWECQTRNPTLLRQMLRRFLNQKQRHPLLHLGGIVSLV